MRDTEFTGTRRGNPGARKDLGSRSMMEREVSAGASSGVRWVGSTSRWKDDPHPGEVGGRSGCNIDKWSGVER